MPMMMMDLQFNIVLANDSYCRLSGLSREKLLTMNAKSFRVLEQKGEGLKVVLQQKKRSFGEVTVEFQSGIKILEQYGLPLLDDKGALVHILTVYNDVTTQREQEKRIAAMIEEARTGKELLAASAGELETAMTCIARGNLTHMMSIDKADPLVKLKADYNTAIDAIRSVMEELSRSLLQLTKTITEMNRSTAEILKATEQVAAASQKSSDNTSANLKAIERLTSEMGDISASIEEIASTSQEVSQHARMASEEGHVAADLGKVATSKMQAVEKISQESVDEITRLNEQMREIGKIVKLIADIANQTNLLALNAAIEAARAGEHGRGFAVVAGEVKSLAGESKNASNQIESLIRAIQAKSEITANSMKNSFEEIKTGIDTVNRTIESLNRIVAESEVVTHGITQITKATVDQAEATNRVMAQTEESKTFTKENLDRLQDMAAMAEETNASTEEIARGSAALNEMADRLKKMMEEFTLH
jgi:methyl-accepting chemotaxis protein